MQPAPHNAIPASVAIGVIVSRSPWADPNKTADRAPAAAAAANWSGSTASGTPSRTTSTGSSRSASDGTHGSSPMRSYRGFTRWNRAEPRCASRIMREPKLSGRGLAPTSAIDRAPSMAATADLTSRLTLAPVLARASLRSSLGIVFGSSCLDSPSLRSSLVPRCDPHSGSSSGVHVSTHPRSGPRSSLAAILTRDRLREFMSRLTLAPVLARPSLRSSLGIVFGPLVHRERRNRRMPSFLSASAARAACQPGIPHTPPPACVPELPLYSPAIGVR